MSIIAKILVNCKRDDETGCLVWQRSIGTKGYGHMRWQEGQRVLYLRPHREIWKHVNRQEIPTGMCVCHYCDNRRCCNPGHLFLGSPADNSRDMTEKGRSARGEHHSQSRLTEENVREIRRRYILRSCNARGGLSLEALGKEFGVSFTTIHAIVQYRTWKHVV